MKKSPPLRHLKQRCRNNFSHHHGSDDIRAGVIGECLLAGEWYCPLVDSMRESIFPRSALASSCCNRSPVYTVSLHRRARIRQSGSVRFVWLLVASKNTPTAWESGGSWLRTGLYLNPPSLARRRGESGGSAYWVFVSSWHRMTCALSATCVTRGVSV